MVDLNQQNVKKNICFSSFDVRCRINNNNNNWFTKAGSNFCVMPQCFFLKMKKRRNLGLNFKIILAVFLPQNVSKFQRLFFFFFFLHIADDSPTGWIGTNRCGEKIVFSLDVPGQSHIRPAGGAVSVAWASLSLLQVNVRQCYFNSIVVNWNSVLLGPGFCLI